jgi:hypothetical protein
MPGQRHDVYRAGSGPGVVVIHEMPGIHPAVAALGRRLVGAGYSVYLPSPFGRPGEPLSTCRPYTPIVRDCVARERWPIARHRNGRPSGDETPASPDLDRLVKASDLEMLAVVGGRERTAAEYRELYANAGFELTRILPLDSLPWSLIESAAPPRAFACSVGAPAAHEGRSDRQAERPQCAGIAPPAANYRPPSRLAADDAFGVAALASSP